MDKSLKNILKSNYVRYIGYLITAVSFYYVYIILQDYNLESLKLDLTIHSYLWILVIGIFHIGNILLGGINYLILLKFVTKPNQKEVNLKYLSIFLVAGIAKYVPGNMMHYLGRNIIGSKYGLSNSQLFLTSILEVGSLVIIPLISVYLLFILGFITLPYVDLSKYLILDNSILKYVLILTIFLIGLGIFFYFLKKSSNVRLKNKFDVLFNLLNNKAFFITLFYSFLIFIISFIFNGLLIYAIDQLILSKQLPIDLAINITAVCVLTNYASILTPGVPGGIGIKEAMTINILSLYGLEQGYFLSIMLVSRFMSIFADIIGYFIGIYIQKKYM